MQDRILGPLTMVQFVYAVIGFGLCYIIYNSVPTPVSYVFILPIAIFVVCLDFVKVNERPFLDFFLSAIAFFTSPRQRFWHQGDDSDLSIEIYKVQKQEGPKVQQKNITPERIAEIARRLDNNNNS